MNAKRKIYTLAALCMYPVFLFMAVRLSSFPGGGLAAFIDFAGRELTERPFAVHFTKATLKAVLISSFIYYSVAFLIISSIKNTRRGEEYGSARFESPGYINRLFKTDKKKLMQQYQYTYTWGSGYRKIQRIYYTEYYADELQHGHNRS